MERELFRHHLVWAGAGSPRHVVGMAPAELARVAQARQMDVVTDETYDSPRPKES
jgi:prolyl-tRNA editing enzyme YbaK/EbsC (Cys-tRNA(Pro) deacylase)